MITQDKVIQIYSMADDFRELLASQIKNNLVRHKINPQSRLL